MTCAVAVFVKSPELSLPKSRLARDIGEARARTFYELCVECVTETLESLGPGIVPHWAVAEPHGLELPRWSQWARVAQGTGDLGARLELVSSTLLERHSTVILLGADAPLMPSSRIVEARAALATADCVAGPARDGGFYLLGLRAPLPLEAWQSVPYSQSTTLERLLEQVSGRAELLGPERDVDTIDDLNALAEEARALTARNPSQERLLHWLSTRMR
jgi:glycosyltransferase A (GT-A) superfamily protein (DUF2064 family)